MTAKAHRGRVQAQGGNVEESVDWGRDTSPPAAEGHAMLNELRAKLADREQGYRAQAFVEAHDGVDRTAAVGGIPQDGRYPAGKSFPQPPRKDGRRVDIEVWKGKAFVSDDVDRAPEARENE